MEDADIKRLFYFPKLQRQFCYRGLGYVAISTLYYYTDWQGANSNIVGYNTSSFTSEIWPQSYIITFQQSVHRFFNQRHIARVTDTMEEKERKVAQQI